MTPRKETEPTKEQREAAEKLYDLFHPIHSIAVNSLATFLARREEARDKRWRDAVEKLADIINGLGLLQIAEMLLDSNMKASAKACQDALSNAKGVLQSFALLSQPAAEEGRP